MRVDGGEEAACHGVFLSVDGAYRAVVVDVVEQASVCHAPFWVTLEEPCFLLELQDGYCLVHLCRQLSCFLVHVVAAQQLGLELGAWVVGVCLHGECCERHEVYAVAFLKCGKVGIAKREAKHVADAGIVARTGSHPKDVVVAPLYVPTVVVL